MLYRGMAWGAVVGAVVATFSLAGSWAPNAITILENLGQLAGTAAIGAALGALVTRAGATFPRGR